MKLDSIAHGASGHLERFFDQETRNLITVLCLPLVDGVFATLLVSGSLEKVSGVFSVALTIFAGAGALAMVFSMSGTRAEVRRRVLKACMVLLPGASLVAVLAPLYGSLVSLQIMRRVAALVLIVLAGKLVGIDLFKDLPIHVVLVTGVSAAFRLPQNLSLTFKYLAPALSAAFVASAILFLSTYIRGSLVRLSTLKKGAGAVLAVLSASLAGLPVGSNLAMYVLIISLACSLRISYIKESLLGDKSVIRRVLSLI